MNPNFSSEPWLHLDLMIRAGVPHAMEIASALADFRLSVPISDCASTDTADLKFYCIIHRAYRSKVLRKYLELMEFVKNTNLNWDALRDSQSLQDEIVRMCTCCTQFSVEDLMLLISQQNAPGDLMELSPVKGQAEAA